MNQTFVDQCANKTVHKHVSSFFNFPRYCELHKALGSAFLGHTKQNLLDSFISSEDACISSSLNQSSAWEFGGVCVKGHDAEHLLEAVVSNACSGSDDNSSKSAKSSAASSEQYAASSIAQIKSEGSTMTGKLTVPWSSGTTSFLGRGVTASMNSYPSDSSFENMMGAFKEEHQKKDSGYLHPLKGSKLSNFSKGRAKPGENKKPRPRDRQLIQDRVKELRDLVPSGAKCSIDGLLDCTIKHMLFLRSVTDQADKLRQCVHQEVSGQRNIKSCEIKACRQNGTSWAFELGSEKQLCPILVEDLEFPGHMIIEMLCEDHVRFLEIAEAIRRLELTILKGVMETRSGNTWAHFIVEASRDFHRLDIFWPLMQLLQQNRAPISSKI
ncbi:unnamed protein product [Ilex paraguariensis]|uniref:BHLH domain-containing protein n=1 Tax=Ilex paraguariensis TaxID=185542 RepID=A0ABC8UXC0_9AQUA